MKNIEAHLVHMLAGDQTNATNAINALLSEITQTSRDRAALERLGRHVLQLISDDLKAGIHAQKTMLNAMGRHDGR